MESILKDFKNSSKWEITFYVLGFIIIFLKFIILITAIKITITPNHVFEYLHSGLSSKKWKRVLFYVHFFTFRFLFACLIYLAKYVDGKVIVGILLAVQLISIVSIVLL